MQPTFASNESNIICIVKKIKKSDKPMLKPIEKAKRGRKKNPIYVMTKTYGDFNIEFL